MEDLVNYAVKDRTNVSSTNSRNLDRQSREVLCGCYTDNVLPLGLFSLGMEGGCLAFRAFHLGNQGCMI
jgi:hypothetical protein